jgi:hypothetical protein
VARHALEGADLVGAVEEDLDALAVDAHEHLARVALAAGLGDPEDLVGHSDLELGHGERARAHVAAPELAGQAEQDAARVLRDALDAGDRAEQIGAEQFVARQRRRQGRAGRRIGDGVAWRERAGQPSGSGRAGGARRSGSGGGLRSDGETITRLRCADQVKGRTKFSSNIVLFYCGRDILFL